ncbi:hypothetical protein [Chitinophaga pinensis]|uniref:Uncharacterized protein n=1 Tax=Chitinophaga pinensis (strain ATCC 43595 / DSM 2588 / LMG 13176 / NBRC 15968 / NCIMB 11800 / UQM 2034) TaxID=485918 RepID=A0A979G1E4_CHIPD|nr:hypothetical protein [Chitinophaga pinensis]ACU58783.1 hypothetical protein Cpin_1285 [Chitinophaga pinensis DSM 2588]
MRFVAVSLSLTGLFLFLPACDKNDDQSASEKGSEGRVVLYSNTGSGWTNCHDQQTYEHVLNTTLSDGVCFFRISNDTYYRQLTKISLT